MGGGDEGRGVRGGTGGGVDHQVSLEEGEQLWRLLTRRN